MTDSAKIKSSLNDYIQYFETLSHRSIRLIEKIADPQIHFQDPFNDVHGIDQVEKIFKKMFEDVRDPKFKVLDHAISSSQDKAYLRWVFGAKAKDKDKRIEIHGMSEITFGPGGKIIEHIDHWDSGTQFYAHIPVLGTMIRWVQSKLKI